MKNLDCKFIGSFYKLEQIPKDRRPQIAFAGRSNVGKSTLLNKLTGQKKLAKVSQTPGKTRSVNFFLINDKFYFVDLPGYGYAKVSKKERDDWAKLLEEYLSQSPHLKGIIILLDCRREPNTDDIQLIDWVATKEMPAIAVVTKADKLNRDKINQKVKQIEKNFGLSAIPFSAVNGVGKNEIFNAIESLLENN